MAKKVKKSVLFVAACLIGLVLFFAPGNLPLYELILFPCPDARTPDISAELAKLNSSNLSAKEVVFPSKNGNLLHGIFVEVPNTKRVFLFSHGKGNNIYSQLMKLRCFCACGASVLMYDYQGFGKSQGRPTIEGACEDAMAAYDYLIKDQNRKPADIIAFGQSFGSGVTGQLALHRQLAGVVMLSGFSSLLSAGRDSLPWLRLYPEWSFPQQMMDNATVFRSKHVPLMIVHGRTDKIISCNEAINLYNCAAPPKALMLLPEGHSTFGKGNKFAIALKQFMQQNAL